MRLRATLLAVSAALSASAFAFADAPKQIDIPAGELSQALLQLSKQYGADLVYRPEQVHGLKTRGVHGELTTEQAVTKILEGTKLELKMDSSGAMLIADPRVKTLSENSMPLRETTSGTGERLRLAQEDQGSNQGPSTKERNSKSTGDSSDASSAASGSSTEDSGRRGIPEVLVTGSNSLDVDIQRTRDDALPYVTFDSKEIEASQATNLEDFFKKRLTMNTSASTSSQGGSYSTNISSINLRGLGANQTLILVDGRRAPRILEQGNEFSQADINGIPLAAIERIEVLPSTAGGIYGGGAVGGVINIIRKHDYEGMEIRAGYDGPFREGGETFRISLNGGLSLEGGRTQIGFSASDAESSPLLVGDNNLWQRGRALYVANGGVETYGLNFSGSTPNIQSAPFYDPSCGYCASYPNLILDNGTALNSNHTYVPPGYSGVASDAGAALLANAGKYNLALSNDIAGRDATMLNNPRVRSANLNVRRSFGEAVDAYTDFTISDNLGRGRSLGSAGNEVTLSADTPNNPFQQSINVFFPVTGLDLPVESYSDTIEAMAGVIARLGQGWTATAEYQWSQSRNKSTLTTYPLSAEGTAALSDGTLDVVRDPNTHLLDFSPYALSGPDQIQGPFVTVQQLTSARVSGPLWELPGGRIDLTALAEHRNEQASQNSSIYPNPPPSPDYRIAFPERAQAVDSGYVEVRAPWVSQRNAILFVQSLELQASLRHDRYTTRVGSPSESFLYSSTDPLPDFVYSSTKLQTTDYTLAIRWAPFQDITFRSSLSTGFLPPSISQLSSTSYPISFQSTTLDPLRGNEPLGTHPYSLVIGGNSDLTPELSRSLSFGAILTPRLLPGLRLSVDYSRIGKNNEINTLTDRQILSNEATFPGRVVRGPKLPGDPPDWAGPVTSLDISLINIARSQVQAYDFQADYSWSTRDAGNFRAFAVATRQVEFQRQLAPDSAPYDSVGFADGPLAWRGNVGLDWSFRSWDVEWNAQYYEGYRVENSSDPYFDNPLLVLTQGTDHIPSQLYHDLNARYRVAAAGSSLMSGVSISVGIQNIFDKYPPAVAQAIYGYSFYGDPRLRRYMLNIAKSFGN